MSLPSGADNSVEMKIRSTTPEGVRAKGKFEMASDPILHRSSHPRLGIVLIDDVAIARKKGLDKKRAHKRAVTQWSILIALGVICLVIACALASTAFGHTSQSDYDHPSLIHSGRVKKVVVRGNQTSVVFEEQPPDHPQAYTCTKGSGWGNDGVHIVASRDGTARATVNDWRMASSEEWSYVEMKIEVPAGDVKNVEAAVENGTGNFVY